MALEDYLKDSEEDALKLVNHEGLQIGLWERPNKE